MFSRLRGNKWKLLPFGIIFNKYSEHFAPRVKLPAGLSSSITVCDKKQTNIRIFDFFVNKHLRGAIRRAIIIKALQTDDSRARVELDELTAYAKENYKIEEEHKWEAFPSFSVLVNPKTQKWVALLMRWWDEDSGSFIERCDLKCGQNYLYTENAPYLSPPFRMKGSKWLGIAFTEQTKKETVFRLFDAAMQEEKGAYTLVLNPLEETETRYQETSLPFSSSEYFPPKELFSERFRSMRRLYVYGRESFQEKSKNFFLQAKFMEDFEVEEYLPWEGFFQSYYPTYQELSSRELTAYFSWRTEVRKGVYHSLPTSAAYLYVYELLNGIGVSSPEESAEKLFAFQEGFLDSGLGDKRMRSNLLRWGQEFCLLHSLPLSFYFKFFEPSILEREKSLCVLREPSFHTNEEVITSLFAFAEKRFLSSPVFSFGDKAVSLLVESWKKALTFESDGKYLFTLCFGEPSKKEFRPLANALYYPQGIPREGDYLVNECRRYRYENGKWQVECLDGNAFNKTWFYGFLQECDRLFRKYFKISRPLKEKAENAWATKYILQAIREDQLLTAEKAKPKIKIDFSSLDKIRQDASKTRDSLLTEEEISEETFEEPFPKEVNAEEELPAPVLLASQNLTSESDFSPSKLTKIQWEILNTLLAGNSPKELLKAHRLMPSLVADELNELLFEEIGDTAILCENDELTLVEDYLEEIRNFSGENGYYDGEKNT